MGVGSTTTTIHSPPKSFVVPRRRGNSGNTSHHRDYDQRKSNEMTKHGPSKEVAHVLHRGRFSSSAPSFPRKEGSTGLSPVLSLFPPRPPTTTATSTMPTIPLPPRPPPLPPAARATISTTTTTMTPASSFSYGKDAPSSVISLGDIYPYTVAVTASQQTPQYHGQRHSHNRQPTYIERHEEQNNTLLAGMMTTPVPQGVQFTRPRGDGQLRSPTGDRLMRLEDRHGCDDGAMRQYGTMTATIGGGDMAIGGGGDDQMHSNRRTPGSVRGSMREDVLKRAETVVKLMMGVGGSTAGDSGDLRDEDEVVVSSLLPIGNGTSPMSSSLLQSPSTSTSVPRIVTVDSSMQTDEPFSTAATPASKTLSSPSSSSPPPLIARSPPPSGATGEPDLALDLDPPAQTTSFTIQTIESTLPVAPVSSSNSTALTASVDPYNTLDPFLAGITAAAAEDAVKVVMLSEDLRQLNLKYEEQTERLSQREVGVETMDCTYPLTHPLTHPFNAYFQHIFKHILAPMIPPINSTLIHPSSHCSSHSLSDRSTDPK